MTESASAESAVATTGSAAASSSEAEAVAALGVASDEPEAWEVKVEQAAVRDEKELQMVMDTLGLTPEEIAQSEASLGVEAWEKKAVAEKAEECAAVAADPTVEDSSKPAEPKKGFFSWLFGKKEVKK